LEELLRTRAPQSIAMQKYDIARSAGEGGSFEERYWSVLLTPVFGAGSAVRNIIATVEDVTDFVRLQKEGQRGRGNEAEDGQAALRLMREAVEARRRAEAAGQAARASEERYRSLFESIDAGFCVLEMIYDAQGRAADYRFVEANAAFARQTGLKDPLSRTMREQVPEHEQHWFDTYARVAETGEPVRFVQAAKPLMGGWYDVYAYRVGGPGSRLVGVLFNDISERVRALEALKDADRRKDEFLATLAHELRNPLAPIRNALSIMRLKSPHDPDLAAARCLIERQVAHLVRLVDDLLDVSRVTFGKVQLRRERLDLRAVAQDALATSKPALEVERADGEARIVVQDNGIGIPPEMLGPIFDTFIQLGSHGGAARGGIGIGLSLSRMLTQLHGGHIHAESRGLGQGSRFTVCLPLAEPSVEMPPEAPHARAATLRRFLVVDDNVDSAASQAQLLRMLGHDAETANSGEEAMRKAARFRPEVVLLDLGMPGMDGFAVARELRRMPETSDAMLIAQTGWGQDEDRQRTLEAGFDAHLAKPVELDALMETLSRIATPVR
jgi:signal transduction histidine kinase